MHVGKRRSRATHFWSYKSILISNVQHLAKLWTSQCSEVHGSSTCITCDQSKNYQGVTGKALPSTPSPNNFLTVIYWKIFSWPSNSQSPNSKVQVGLELSCYYKLILQYHYIYVSQNWRIIECLGLEGTLKIT